MLSQDRGFFFFSLQSNSPTLFEQEQDNRLIAKIDWPNDLIRKLSHRWTLFFIALKLCRGDKTILQLATNVWTSHNLSSWAMATRPMVNTSCIAQHRLCVSVVVEHICTRSPLDLTSNFSLSSRSCQGHFQPRGYSHKGQRRCHWRTHVASAGESSVVETSGVRVDTHLCLLPVLPGIVHNLPFKLRQGRAQL